MGKYRPAQFRALTKELEAAIEDSPCLFTYRRQQRRSPIGERERQLARRNYFCEEIHATTFLHHIVIVPPEIDVNDLNLQSFVPMTRTRNQNHLYTQKKKSRKRKRKRTKENWGFSVDCTSLWGTRVGRGGGGSLDEVDEG